MKEMRAVEDTQKAAQEMRAIVEQADSLYFLKKYRIE